MAMSIAALMDPPITVTDDFLADGDLEEDDFNVHVSVHHPSDDEEVDEPQQTATGSAPTSLSHDGVASNLAECFHQTHQHYPTLDIAFDTLRDTAHAHGFAVKTKRERNADKAKGERSEQTNKEFKKMRYVQCACAGVTKADPTASAETGKHNHAATDDIRINPMARKGTVEQEAFVQSLLRARTSTAKI
ncbi:hypothetical protein DFS34DRAFT_590923 [Phlyctochytrium arcticum]|nr:hypothetical protein DFS34DRAFT_590923 [Phlyctochytrium arcticum]